MILHDGHVWHERTVSNISSGVELVSMVRLERVVVDPTAALFEPEVYCGFLSMRAIVRLRSLSTLLLSQEAACLSPPLDNCAAMDLHASSTLSIFSI